MSEQELVKKEEEEKEEKKEEKEISKISKIIKENTWGNDTLYKSDEFLNKLEEYYDIYGNFKVVAERLNEDFDCKINKYYASKIHKKYIAIKISTDNEAREFFEKSFIRMQKRWEDSWEMIGDLIYQYKKFRKLMKEKGEMEQALTFLKKSGVIISIITEVRNQLDFIRKQQNEIKIYQQNNLIISPIQIHQEIKNLIPKMGDKELMDFLKSTEDKRFKKFLKYLEDGK